MVVEPRSEAVATRGHMPALDGMRGVAILLVMAFHFVSTGATVAQGGASVFDRVLYGLTGTGWVGVHVFFVLSGFLITGILLDTKGSAGFLRSFYARRVLRIFPLYYAYLAALLIVVPLAAGARFEAPFSDQVWYWFYLPDIRAALDPAVHANRFYNTTGHLWSLAVEEQFYLIWPAVVLLTSRRQLVVVSAAAIAASLVVRSGFHVSYAGVGPAQMDGLVFGGLLAIAARSVRGRELAARWLPSLGAASALALAAMFVLSKGQPLHIVWMQPIITTGVAWVSGSILWAAVSRSGARNPAQTMLAWGPLRNIGKYSYGLYILHQPLTVLAAWRIDAAGGLPTVAGMQAPAVIALALLTGAASYAAAWVSWHTFESRFLRLKSRFAYSASQPATAVRRREAVDSMEFAERSDFGREVA